MKNTSNKLRVVHVPQVGYNHAFYICVKDELEAMKITNIIANHHNWLFSNNIIPDYSNIIIVEMFNEENQEWENYCNENEDYAEWEDIEDLLQSEIEYLNLGKNF